MIEGVGASDTESRAALLAVVGWACHSACPPQVERVTEGASTEVYRLRCDGAVLYLRLLPEVGASFAPEVLAHRWLRARGAKVPEVVYSEDCEPRLRRSVMVVREVPGAALTAVDAGPATVGVLAAAGRDLALVNGLPVQGFGWVRRDAGSGEALRGECETYAEWALDGVDAAVDGLTAAGVLAAADAEAVRRTIAARREWGSPATAVLAHGDFDGSHIYHDRGAYSGIIDFGEIRGADPCYDLAHFQIEHPTWLPLLLAGYREAASTPPDLEQRIQFSTLVLATRRLASWLARGRRPHAPDVEAIARALRALS